MPLPEPEIDHPAGGEPAAGSAARERSQATGREFILLVTALMATTALGIDLMLPAFPEIRQQFGMAPDSTQVAWIVTAYFLGMAAGPWLYGPASDRFGRRKPLLAGLALYAVAATTAALAPSWKLIVVARFVWGLGAAGPRSLSVAMIRDRFEGDAMARLMSMIMAVFMLVPIVAPGVGAGLIAILPWRAVFWFPAIAAGLLMVWSRRLPETLTPALQRPFTWRAVGAAGREVVTHRQTMALTAAMVCLFASMTTYLAGSEVILEDTYGYGSWFPLFFGGIAVLLAVNSLNNARLVGRLGVVRLLRLEAMIALAAALALVAISFASDGGRPSFWLFVLVLAVLLPAVQGLAPNTNTLAMSPLPHVAGTASAIISTLTSAGGALLGGLASGAFDGTVRPFAVYLLVFAGVAATFIVWGTAAAERERKATAANAAR
ncbi:MAG: multidrug effflux MFS transporter [Actinomycetota bacterium]|nr:multidrug effflux MFS transporter [Actinomycetota bacterium]